MTDDKLATMKKRFEGVIPPEHIEVLYAVMKDELTDSGEPLFTVLALLCEKCTVINGDAETRVLLRCNTCGYDLRVPLVLGQKFHCPACRTYANNKITSVLPFIVKRVEAGASNVEM